MGYKRLDEKDLMYIKQVIGDDERILYGENINEEYSHDELSGTQSYPDVVVKAANAEEISKIMSYAYEHTIPVTPRGAGTGLVGSSVAMEHGIMMDTSLMNQILELDEENLTVTVEPGVLLMELSAFVEDHDFFYPPDPGEKSATIGGNISTNAGGMRAVNKRLCPWTGSGSAQRKDCRVRRENREEQFRLCDEGSDGRVRGNTGNYYEGGS